MRYLHSVSEYVNHRLEADKRFHDDHVLDKSVFKIDTNRLGYYY